MKSKILALSTNEEFKILLKQKKISNEYVAIFFGHLKDKNKKMFNISFVTKKKIGNAFPIFFLVTKLILNIFLFLSFK